MEVSISVATIAVSEFAGLTRGILALRGIAVLHIIVTVVTGCGSVHPVVSQADSQTDIYPKTTVPIVEVQTKSTGHSQITWADLVRNKRSEKDLDNGMCQPLIPLK